MTYALLGVAVANAVAGTLLAISAHQGPMGHTRRKLNLFVSRSTYLAVRVHS